MNGGVGRLEEAGLPVYVAAVGRPLLVAERLTYRNRRGLHRANLVQGVSPRICLADLLWVSMI
jgi:hypothetical protein